VTNGIAAALKSEIKNLHSALRSFDKTLQKVIASNGTGETTRARRRISFKHRAALVLQGRYMGYMRQLKPRQKAQVRKIKEAKGVRAAIARAKRLAA
jgi:hypothetical protein